MKFAREKCASVPRVLCVRRGVLSSLSCTVELRFLDSPLLLFLFSEQLSVRGLCIATEQYSSLCASAVVFILGGSDDMEVDEQDREQVDSERESRGARGRGR